MNSQRFNIASTWQAQDMEQQHSDFQPVLSSNKDSLESWHVEMPPVLPKDMYGILLKQNI